MISPDTRSLAHSGRFSLSFVVVGVVVKKKIASTANRFIPQFHNFRSRRGRFIKIEFSFVATLNQRPNENPFAVCLVCLLHSFDFHVSFWILQKKKNKNKIKSKGLVHAPAAELQPKIEKLEKLIWVVVGHTVCAYVCALGNFDDRNRPSIHLNCKLKEEKTCFNRWHRLGGTTKLQYDTK